MNTRKRKERGKCTKGIRKMKVGVKDGDKKAGMGPEETRLAHDISGMV